MEHTLVLDYFAPIPVGHRVEFSAIERAKGETYSVTDLDSGIQYLPGDAGTHTWQGVVVSCVVTPGAKPKTTLVVDNRQGKGAAAAQEALEGADAALSEARAEAARWSSKPWNLPSNR